MIDPEYKSSYRPWESQIVFNSLIFVKRFKSEGLTDKYTYLKILNKDGNFVKPVLSNYLQTYNMLN